MIRLHLPRVQWGFVLLVSALILAGLAVEVARPRLGDESMLVGWFSLSEECNIPTWLSSVILLACSLVLAALGAIDKAPATGRSSYRYHWIGLSLIFLYISIDEAIEIHEWLSETGILKGRHGLLYFSWVAPFSVLVLVFALSYLRFLRHLPPRTRFKIALSGVLYVGGALGVEVILGMYADAYGTSNLGYALIDLVEEALELIGASLFLVTLLEYLGTLGELRVSITNRE